MCMSEMFKEKKFILSLARRSIETYLKTERILEIDPAEVSEELKEERACFVTLTINGQLRGCIGHLLPIQELYQDVIENAVAAAFQDPRFPPLTAEEWPRVKIEISILSIPRPLSFSSSEDLLKKLRPNVDGVIIKQGRRQATFLPQVWENMPSSQEFLEHLCLKAGLSDDCWKEKGIEVEVYEVV